MRIDIRLTGQLLCRKLGLGKIKEERTSILYGGNMAHVIDLEGLPDPVAKAITETVMNLKNRYRPGRDRQPPNPPRDLPSRPGKVIGSLRRVEIYDEP